MNNGGTSTSRRLRGQAFGITVLTSTALGLVLWQPLTGWKVFFATTAFTALVALIQVTIGTLLARFRRSQASTDRALQEIQDSTAKLATEMERLNAGRERAFDAMDQVRRAMNVPVLGARIQAELAEVLESAKEVLEGTHRVKVRDRQVHAQEEFSPLGDLLADGRNWDTVTRLDFWMRENMGECKEFRDAQVEATRRGGRIRRVLLLPRESLLFDDLEQRVPNDLVVDVLCAILELHEELHQAWLQHSGDPTTKPELLVFHLTKDEDVPDTDLFEIANFAVLTGKPEESFDTTMVRMVYPRHAFDHHIGSAFNSINMTRLPRKGPNDMRDLEWGVEKAQQRFEIAMSNKLTRFSSDTTLLRDLVKGRSVEVRNKISLVTEVM